MACVGFRWPSLACADLRCPLLSHVGLHWPALTRHEPVLACIGLRWPALACVGLHWLPIYILVHKLSVEYKKERNINIPGLETCLEPLYSPHSPPHSPPDPPLPTLLVIVGCGRWVIIAVVGVDVLTWQESEMKQITNNKVCGYWFNHFLVYIFNYDNLYYIYIYIYYV